MGCGCSTVVEHSPYNLDAVGTNPAGCLAFFFFFYLVLLSFTCRSSLNKSLKEVHLYLCVVKAIKQKLFSLVQNRLKKLRLSKKRTPNKKKMLP